MARQYRMRISRLTVDKLGVKLYDRASAVVAELISNSYDADASQVTIEAPMGQYLASHAGGVVKDRGLRIEVIDDGCGMVPDELQDFYLIVGKERRNDPKRGDVSKKFKRQVTGRKGVGKLAPFGICKVIEVISSGGNVVSGAAANGKPAKGYLTSHIILNYDDIVGDDEADYVPQTGPLDGTIALASGTRTVLRDFYYRKVPDMEVLARQLAQRFGIESKNWKITLRDNTKTPKAAGYQQVVGAFDIETMTGAKIHFEGPELTLRKGADASKYKAIGPDSKTVKEFGAGFEHEGSFYPLRGWVAYSKTPYKDDLMAGVRIYCRGKIAAQTSVFGRRAGFTGEHTVRSYLVGELHADWLDEDEDLIQTDRRDILWSHDVASEFQEWGQKVVAKIGTLARDPLRQSTKDKFFKASKIEERAEKEFPGVSQKQIRAQVIDLAGVFGRTMSPGDVDDPEVVRDFADLILLLAPHVELDKKLREAAETEVTPVALISEILRTARLAELASFGRIADDRIKVIDQLLTLKDASGTTESELQTLIEAAPWLVNPQWAPISANAAFNTLKKAFEKFYKAKTKKEIVLADFTETGKRPDFVLSSQDTILQIIEIKRPGHKISNAEMDRIITYNEQMEAFLDDPKHNEFRDMFSDFHITLVADGHTLSGAQKATFNSMRKERRLTHLDWESFLARTQKMHQSFLEEAAKQRTRALKLGKKTNAAA